MGDEESVPPDGGKLLVVGMLLVVVGVLLVVVGVGVGVEVSVGSGIEVGVGSSPVGTGVGSGWLGVCSVVLLTPVVVLGSAVCEPGCEEGGGSIGGEETELAGVLQS